MRGLGPFVLTLLISPALAVPTLDPHWGTIFPPARAMDLVRQCSRATPGPVSGTWQPTPAQIAALEARLAGVLAEQLARRADTGFAAQDYYRQYAGLVIAGRKIVYVNGFHRELIDQQVRVHSHVADWHSVPALVCDGGALTFGVEYDPATGAFSRFGFNGSI